MNLDELEAALAKMTPGPWNNHLAANNADARGIVLLVNNGQALLAAARERDKLREAIVDHLLVCPDELLDEALAQE